MLVKIGPAQSGQWRTAIGTEKGQLVPAKTFQNWRSALVEAGLVEVLSQETNTYQVTAKGKEVANGTLSSAP